MQKYLVTTLCTAHILCDNIRTGHVNEIENANGDGET